MFYNPFGVARFVSEADKIANKYNMMVGEVI